MDMTGYPLVPCSTNIALCTMLTMKRCEKQTLSVVHWYDSDTYVIYGMCAVHIMEWNQRVNVTREHLQPCITPIIAFFRCLSHTMVGL